MIPPPVNTDRRCKLADWLELHAFFRNTHKSYMAEVFSCAGILEDPPAEEPINDEDPEIDESKKDLIAASISEELVYRINTLGPSYPFKVTADFTVIELCADWEKNVGTRTYVFCLLVSAIRERRLFLPRHADDVIKHIAAAFQVCACLAAGGYFGGHVVSFGHPRTDSTGFVDGLKAAYERFNAGTVRDLKDSEILKRIEAWQKDGGIDIIAWKPMPDSLSGKIYALGQSASGKNWVEKSIETYVSKFHSWLNPMPARYYLPCIFIPFPIYYRREPRNTDDALQVRKDLYWFEELEFGVIFDRMRLPYYAGVWEELDDEEKENIDASRHVKLIDDWIHSVCDIVGELTIIS